MAAGDNVALKEDRVQFLEAISLANLQGSGAARIHAKPDELPNSFTTGGQLWMSAPPVVDSSHFSCGHHHRNALVFQVCHTQLILNLCHLRNMG